MRRYPPEWSVTVVKIDLLSNTIHTATFYAQNIEETVWNCSSYSILEVNNYQYEYGMNMKPCLNGMNFEMNSQNTPHRSKYIDEHQSRSNSVPRISYGCSTATHQGIIPNWSFLFLINRVYMFLCESPISIFEQRQASPSQSWEQEQMLSVKVINQHFMEMLHEG